MDEIAKLREMGPGCKWVQERYVGPIYMIGSTIEVCKSGFMIMNQT